jgi:hypothetical protein
MIRLWHGYNMPITSCYYLCASRSLDSGDRDWRIVYWFYRTKCEIVSGDRCIWFDGFRIHRVVCTGGVFNVSDTLVQQADALKLSSGYQCTAAIRAEAYMQSCHNGTHNVTG